MLATDITQIKIRSGKRQSPAKIFLSVINMHMVFSAYCGMPSILLNGPCHLLPVRDFLKIISLSRPVTVPCLMVGF